MRPLFHSEFITATAEASCPGSLVSGPGPGFSRASCPWKARFRPRPRFSPGLVPVEAVLGPDCDFRRVSCPWKAVLDPDCTYRRVSGPWKLVPGPDCDFRLVSCPWRPFWAPTGIIALAHQNRVGTKGRSGYFFYPPSPFVRSVDARRKFRVKKWVFPHRFYLRRNSV